jgi:hypothetical protein
LQSARLRSSIVALPETTLAPRSAPAPRFHLAHAEIGQTLSDESGSAEAGDIRQTASGESGRAAETQFFRQRLKNLQAKPAAEFSRRRLENLEVGDRSSPSITSEPW